MPAAFLVWKILAYSNGPLANFDSNVKPGCKLCQYHNLYLSTVPKSWLRLSSKGTCCMDMPPNFCRHWGTNYTVHSLVLKLLYSLSPTTCSRDLHDIFEHFIFMSICSSFSKDKCRWPFLFWKRLQFFWFRTAPITVCYCSSSMVLKICAHTYI